METLALMDQRVSRIAALANLSTYNAEGAEVLIDGSPHLKHASLRRLYGSLVVEVFDNARTRVAAPKVLDLGAGEGSVTVPFLELGAHVLAVDLSANQLAVLQSKCEQFSSQLEVCCEDAGKVLEERTNEFDIVALNSFLHHVPDYLGLIEQATKAIKPGGQFFSFQDPLRYDTSGRASLMFSRVAYASWRVFKGDLVAGLKRRARRARGVYLDDSVHDNAEYHVTRNGVDQEAIRELLCGLGFECRVVPYFSTQSRLFQPIGSAMGITNTFAVIARKRD